MDAFRASHEEFEKMRAVWGCPFPKLDGVPLEAEDIGPNRHDYGPIGSKVIKKKREEEEESSGSIFWWTSDFINKGGSVDQRFKNMGLVASMPPIPALPRSSRRSAAASFAPSAGSSSFAPSAGSSSFAPSAGSSSFAPSAGSSSFAPSEASSSFAPSEASSSFTPSARSSSFAPSAGSSSFAPSAGSSSFAPSEASSSFTPSEASSSFTPSEASSSFTPSEASSSFAPSEASSSFAPSEASSSSASSTSFTRPYFNRNVSASSTLGFHSSRWNNNVEETFPEKSNVNTDIKEMAEKYGYVGRLRPSTMYKHKSGKYFRSFD